MKKLFFALPLLVFAGSLVAQMNFKKYQWKSLAAEAQKRDVLIFVDAYADWCGPCKRMEREVFSKAEVGDLYNRQFVLSKIDMDDKNGQVFARRYAVSGIPNMLFLDYKGEVVHQITGAMDAERFMRQALVAQTLHAVDKGKKVEEIDGELLYEIVEAKASYNNETHAPFLSAYLKTKHAASPMGWELVAALAMMQDFQALKHLEGNLSDLERQLLPEQVETVKVNILMNAWKPSIKKALEEKKDLNWEPVLADFKRYWTEGEAECRCRELRTAFYSLSQNKEMVWQEVQKMHQHIESVVHIEQRAERYATAARLVLEDFENDSEKLQTALQWAKQGETLAPSKKVYTVLAAIYQAQGNREEQERCRRLAEEE